MTCVSVWKKSLFRKCQSGFKNCTSVITKKNHFWPQKTLKHFFKLCLKELGVNFSPYVFANGIREHINNFHQISSEFLEAVFLKILLETTFEQHLDQHFAQHINNFHYGLRIFKSSFFWKFYSKELLSNILSNMLQPYFLMEIKTTLKSYRKFFSKLPKV